MNGKTLIASLLFIFRVGIRVAFLPGVMSGSQNLSQAELLAPVDALLDVTDPCGAVIENDPDSCGGSS